MFDNPVPKLWSGAPPSLRRAGSILIKSLASWASSSSPSHPELWKARSAGQQRAQRAEWSSRPYISGLSLFYFPQTVQILIGLIHLGFGSVLLMVRRGHLGMLFIEGGVPFWGGACVSAGIAILG